MQLTLKKHTVKEAWESDAFNRFRRALQTSCASCIKRSECMGGCPLQRSIVLCDSEDKQLMTYKEDKVRAVTAVPDELVLSASYDVTDRQIIDKVQYIEVINEKGEAQLYPDNYFTQINFEETKEYQS